jgi:peptide/nickel transport system permease protein
MTIHPLPADIAVWILVIVTVALAAYKRRDDYFIETIRDIFRTRAAMIAAIVLGVFVSIALLDSIHWRIDERSSFAERGETVSILDMSLAHLRRHSERTYSAPFAVREYTKSVVAVEGKIYQRYEPLRHIDPKHALRNGIAGAFGALFFAIVLIALHRRIFRKKARSELPWRSAYVTLIVLFTLAGALYGLSFSYHVFGTDKVGGDLFYAALKSIRTGVLIGMLTTLVTLPFALVLGMVAGYFRGWADDAVQYLYTTLSSIPGVLLIAAGVLSMQMMLQAHPDMFPAGAERADMRLLFLVVVLGVTGWTGLCRMVRAETMRIAQMEFVTAAETFGLKAPHIMLRHILPNLSHIVIISVVLDFSSLVLAEAVLSYVGVGVDPTMYSWGNMIDQARLEMAREPMVWWSLAAAFAFMFALVLAANVLADRVQYVLDPRNAKVR